MADRGAACAEPAGGAPEIDFVGGALGYRFRQGISRRDPLPRAAGFARAPLPRRVVDATAGLGRDAFLLAALGAEVTLIERAPAVHAALAAALDRARAAGPALAAVVGRMTLRLGDSRDLLPGLAPEVVLVDPMHPPRGNTALVRQPMRDLRSVVGADPDAAALMRVALASASRRVVLKWPRLAPPLAGLPAASFRIIGKTVRYDVFLTEPSEPAATVAASPGRPRPG